VITIQDEVLGMAFHYYINMEMLALDIANESINRMTDSNILYDENGNVEESDWDAFQNNFKNGWIVVSMMNNYIECIINTILRDCVCYNGEKLLKASMEEKLEILYMYYKTDITVIKSEHYWGELKKLIKIRNELTHFKNNYIGISGSVPLSWNKPLDEVGDYFTSIKIKKVKNKIITLANKIVSDLGLAINTNAGLLYGEGDIPHVHAPNRCIDGFYE
jgi:hypothetical protein